MGDGTCRGEEHTTRRPIPWGLYSDMPPITRDYRVSMASLKRSATAFVTMIRQYWDIENKLHWSLDVTRNEDRSRIWKELALEQMASLRLVALNLVRREPSHPISLRQKRRLGGLDKNDLLTVLSGAT